MPSAPSRQPRANTVRPSSAMCSLTRIPASVLRRSRTSVAMSRKNCGDDERLLYSDVEKPTDKKCSGWPPSRIQWREVQMSARPSIMQSECLDDNPLSLKAAAEVSAIRLSDLKNDQYPSWRPSLGDLDPLGRLGRLDPLTFARYLITFSIGVGVALAWQSYGNATREGASFKAISLERDAIRQSLDRIAASVATSQEQMTQRIERSIER